MSLTINDNIYSDIASQFPSIYREEGSFLVDFITAYYTHFDATNDRDIPKLKDIDTTLTTFLVYYKKKYLADLPIDTVVDTRFIIKHISDLYKRKGSEESLRLLFRLFFDEDIDVFYPSTALLKPSDSVFGGDTYLEMLPVYTIDNYPIQKGDKLTGNVSLASAFVDEIIFVNFSGALSPIIYLSNISGSFISDDGLTRTRATVDSLIGKLIQGSLSSISVSRLGRQPDQKIGDKVKVVSTQSGIDASAFVTATSTAETGSINYEITDGGFGYADPVTSSASNDVGISNQVLIVKSDNTQAIKTGDIINAYGTNIVTTATGATAVASGMKGSAVVIAYVHPLLYIKTMNNADRIVELAKTYTGNDDNILLTELNRAVLGSDPILSEVSKIYKSTLTIDGVYSARKIGDIDADTNIANDDFLALTEYMLYAAGSSYNAGVLTASKIEFIESVLLPQQGVYDDFVTLTSGTQSQFIVNHDPSKTVTFLTTSAYNVSSSYTLSSITNRETVTLITDQVGDFESVVLNAGTIGNAGDNFGGDDDYGMSGSGAENIGTTLGDAFTPITFTIGTIDSLTLVPGGIDYENDVYSNIENSSILKFNKKDIIFNFPSTVNLSFSINDQITQARRVENIANVDITSIIVSNNTGDYASEPTLTQVEGNTIAYTAKAKFVKRVGNDFYFRQLSFYDFDDSKQINFNGLLVDVTGSTRDANSLPMGGNAVISGQASYGTGQIKDIKLENTGYRFADGETVNIVCDEIGSSSYGNVVATANVRVLGTGSTEGTWKTSSSFISDKNKRIHDNDYYQEYSYDISSSVQQTRYEGLIKETIGVAGTKLFSSSLVSAVNNFDVELDASMESFYVKPFIFETQSSPVFLGAPNASGVNSYGSNVAIASTTGDITFDAFNLIGDSTVYAHALVGALAVGGGNGTITGYTGAVLSGVAISGTSGQFTCDATTLTVNQIISVTGTFDGTSGNGALAGEAGIYKVSSVTGTASNVTGFTLVEARNAIAGQWTESTYDVSLVTATGNTDGLTFESGRLYSGGYRVFDGNGHQTGIRLYDIIDFITTLTTTTGTTTGITYIPVGSRQNPFETTVDDVLLAGDVLSPNSTLKTRFMSKVELDSAYEIGVTDNASISARKSAAANESASEVLIPYPSLPEYDISNEYNSIVGTTRFKDDSDEGTEVFEDKVYINLSSRNNWIGYDTLAVNISNRDQAAGFRFAIEVTDGITTARSATITLPAYSSTNPEQALSASIDIKNTQINRSNITSVALVFILDPSTLDTSGETFPNAYFQWKIWSEGAPIVGELPAYIETVS